jgi:glycosyltransferase involved in cell wall biosynthesis
MVIPVITVLMPVFNASRFLREAIDSILNQTLTEFEFLIIDDGSTDDSVAIVKSYQDPRIKLVINERNLGISATLNKGILLSACELIARMDADDISYPTRLEKQYRYMQMHPECALQSAWARVITEDKKFVRIEKYRREYYYFNLTFECWMYHPTIVFRKTCVQQVGMYSMPYSEDYDLFWKMSTQFKIDNYPEELLHYRLSSSSLNTVLKKQDYEVANEQNVLRNIRYYLGSELILSRPVLDCLRHNFTPIVQSGSFNDVFQALEIIDRVAARMAEIENPNRTNDAIFGARHYKRQFIITELIRLLPAHKAFGLLMLTQEWFCLYTLLHHGLTWRLKKIRTMFFGF